MHSHVFCMRVVLCACCIVIYIVCVNCIVDSYLLYIVCMLCSSSKEERLCRLLRRLNYKSNQIKSIEPGIHFWPFALFFMNTLSPTENVRSRQCVSWKFFCCCCFAATFSSIFGLSRSKRERNFLPSSSSAGVIPVVQ